MGRVKESLPDPDDYKAQDSGEEQELEVLAATNSAAWQRVFSLINTLPVWRSAKQQAVLNQAQRIAEHTKWRLDMARLRSKGFSYARHH